MLTTTKLPGWKDEVPCPRCREGTIIIKNGKHGKFYGCSYYPICAFTINAYDLNQLLDPDIDEPYYGM
jgi:ssDNA-binding Zn-finger/Zn-ribbon topoisomerase 1